MPRSLLTKAIRGPKSRESKKKEDRKLYIYEIAEDNKSEALSILKSKKIKNKNMDLISF